MITFTGPLLRWTSANGSWHFLAMPEAQSAEIRAHALAERRGFGSVRVEARIGEVAWRTSLFPQKSGGYLLPVKKDIRVRSGIDAGDEVTVALDLV